MMLYRFILLALGTIGIAVACSIIIEWNFAKEWPVTLGHIEAEYITAFGTGLPSKAGSADTYIGRIVYIYSVDGKQYSGDRISLWEFTYSTRVQVAKQMHSFNRSELVRVHYDPLHPSHALLTVELPVGPVGLLLLTGTILFAAGIWLPILTRRFLHSLLNN